MGGAFNSPRRGIVRPMPTAKKTIVPLHPTRALRFRLSINHGYAGLVLLVTGIGGLREEGPPRAPVGGDPRGRGRR